jgi:hypothetical protein
VTTVALVQGECLGGGFEGALSHDVIIAERSARFGFPEIHFNLFPGMGAYSLLSAASGGGRPTNCSAPGRSPAPTTCGALGLVDVVVEDGRGEAAVADYIDRRTRSRNGLAALAVARRRVQRIDLAELDDIAEVWVDGALQLTPARSPADASSRRPARPDRRRWADSLNAGHGAPLARRRGAAIPGALAACPGPRAGRMRAAAGPVPSAPADTAADVSPDDRAELEAWLARPTDDPLHRSP